MQETTVKIELGKEDLQYANNRINQTAYVQSSYCGGPHHCILYGSAGAF